MKKKNDDDCCNCIHIKSMDKLLTHCGRCIDNSIVLKKMAIYEESNVSQFKFYIYITLYDITH